MYAVHQSYHRNRSTRSVGIFDALIPPTPQRRCFRLCAECHGRASGTIMSLPDVVAQEPMSGPKIDHNHTELYEVLGRWPPSHCPGLRNRFQVCGDWSDFKKGGARLLGQGDEQGPRTRF
ncbi:hypothetical protein BO70DRAFT_7617 [Aspergillus heteromorphus CBS 117.55]|uniref:Uncharacterized protein n=1 Tax=Aspergillus heteromorphus CBS 117.55 TaxID=1448321 RepID=A0A317X495_9EURO|nr:uncharacterized protein BO70DRAFT_7617 [Aspergillus heteromorphus CBS 117.55]PWY92337.1 hypothetical protein BO70DRAFT_7617 [Aspergillus heteromorphus CBS 117.55]